MGTPPTVAMSSGYVTNDEERLRSKPIGSGTRASISPRPEAIIFPVQTDNQSTRINSPLPIPTSARAPLFDCTTVSSRLTKRIASASVRDITEPSEAAANMATSTGEDTELNSCSITTDPS